MKKEKRGRRSSPYRACKHVYGVLRFDAHLTGDIYVLKSTGRFIPGYVRRHQPVVLPIQQLP
jgi:hypothetical protein